MYSIFNLRRAFDPRHLSIDKEENEPIVCGGPKFSSAHRCQAPGEGSLTPRGKISSQFMAKPQFNSFLISKTFLYFNFKPN